MSQAEACDGNLHSISHSHKRVLSGTIGVAFYFQNSAKSPPSCFIELTYIYLTILVTRLFYLLDYFSYFVSVGSASASQALVTGFESRLRQTFLRRRKISRCLGGVLFTLRRISLYPISEKFLEIHSCDKTVPEMLSTRKQTQKRKSFAIPTRCLTNKIKYL